MAAYAPLMQPVVAVPVVVSAVPVRTVQAKAKNAYTLSRYQYLKTTNQQRAAVVLGGQGKIFVIENCFIGTTGC